MDAPPVGRLSCPGHRRVADVRTGEALKASKRETRPKMRPPTAKAGKTTGRPPVGEAARGRTATSAAKPCSWSRALDTGALSLFRFLRKGGFANNPPLPTRE